MARHETNYKSVLMPVKVPAGTFCFDKWATCGHFDNEGGHPVCGLGFFPLDYTKESDVPKPKECLRLKSV